MFTLSLKIKHSYILIFFNKPKTTCSRGDSSQIVAKPETNWYKAEFSVFVSLSL